MNSCLQKTLRWCALVWLGLLIPMATAAPAPGADQGAFVQSFDFGAVDWTRGLVLAAAEGSAPETAGTREKGFALARRQALIEARHRLFGTVQKIRIQGPQTVKDRMLRRAGLETRLRELIHVSPRMRTERFQDGTRVRAEARLDLKDLARVCLSPSVWTARSPENEPDGRPQNASLNGTGPLPEARSYSGLVLDARGTGVSPALAFQVYDQQGQVVLGPGEVDPQLGQAKGVVQFFSELEAAGIQERVGRRPLRIRVAGAAPGSGGDAQISGLDAFRLALARGVNDFVASCSVAVIIRSSDDSRVIEYSID